MYPYRIMTQAQRLFLARHRANIDDIIYYIINLSSNDSFPTWKHVKFARRMEKLFLDDFFDKSKKKIIAITFVDFISFFNSSNDQSI